MPRLTLRVRAGELETLRNHAERLGLTEAEFLRSAVGLAICAGEGWIGQELMRLVSARSGDLSSVCWDDLSEGILGRRQDSRELEGRGAREEQPHAEPPPNSAPTPNSGRPVDCKGERRRLGTHRKIRRTLSGSSRSATSKRRVKKRIVRRRIRNPRRVEEARRRRRAEAELAANVAAGRRYREGTARPTRCERCGCGFGSNNTGICHSCRP